MIVKKRKRKTKPKKSKRLRKKSNISLNSLPTMDGILFEEQVQNVPSVVPNKNKEETKKILKLIVYINEFDRINKEGKQKCRNNDCENLVCKPFRKYCSRKCSMEFTRWYNKNFYWRNIRNSILKRDDYTCQICRLKLNKKKDTIRKLGIGLSVIISYLNPTTLF